jgi:hypothetical protein
MYFVRQRGRLPGYMTLTCRDRTCCNPAHVVEIPRAELVKLLAGYYRRAQRQGECLFFAADDRLDFDTLVGVNALNGQGLLDLLRDATAPAEKGSAQ